MLSNVFQKIFVQNVFVAVFQLKHSFTQAECFPSGKNCLLIFGISYMDVSTWMERLKKIIF